MVKNAEYTGKFEIPCLHQTSRLIPKKLITFSKALKSTEYDAWIVFYEHDEAFIRIWRNPRKYLNILKRFRGVMSPDFSMYRNMPLVMQAWSTYMSRALALWWQENGIEVIPNVRFSTEDSYEIVFQGIEKHSTVSVGTHGCFKRKLDREYFLMGFDKMMKTIEPKVVIIYGAAPQKYFRKYDDYCHIIQFPSQFSMTHSNARR